MRAMFGWRQVIPALLVCACGGQSQVPSSPGSLSGPGFDQDDPPKLKITYPEDGAQVYGPLTAVADASDDRAGLQVEFFVDGTSIGVVRTRPYQVPWTAPTKPGPFTLSAKATDSGGHTVTDEVRLVKPDQYPEISFDTPKDGAVLRGQVPVFAMTSDDVAIASVEYSVDGNLLALVEAGQRVVWDTTTVANDSSHQVVAIASDNKGHRTSVQSKVRVHDAPPTVEFLSPQGVSVVGGMVRFQAKASDDDGVIGVTYAVDGNPIGTIAAAPYLLDWNTTPIANGTEVTVTAQALDTRGQMTTAEMKLTVQNPPPKP